MHQPDPHAKPAAPGWTPRAIAGAAVLTGLVLGTIMVLATTVALLAAIAH